MPPRKELPATHLPEVPHGYEKIVLRDGKEIIVPQHLLPDVSLAFATYRSMKEIGVDLAKHRFSQAEDIFTERIGEESFSFPPNPLLSEQERLAAHAEVLALMDQLGICYKDASHRLYMDELAKLKITDKTSKSMSNLAVSIKDSLVHLQREAQQDINHSLTYLEVPNDNEERMLMPAKDPSAMVLGDD